VFYHGTISTAGWPRAYAVQPSAFMGRGAETRHGRHGRLGPHLSGVPR
jgi:hypothetical protein